VISFYSDVTEEVMHKQQINKLLEDYKKVNDELKRTQKSMITDTIIEKLLLEHPSCVFKFKNDAALTPILLSTGIKDLTGIDASEFLDSKTSLEQLIFPLDKKLTEQRKKVRKNLKDGQTYKLVYAVKKPDESIITMSEYGKGSFDKTGKLVYIEGFLTLKDDNMFL
jgi:hypothetical protein